jgi:hypothetical protein
LWPAQPRFYAEERFANRFFGVGLRQFFVHSFSTAVHYLSIRSEHRMRMGAARIEGERGGAQGAAGTRYDGTLDTVVRLALATGR